MKFNQYGTLVEAERALRDKGYKENFTLEKEQELRCTTSNKIYGPEDMHILEYHRFEGDSNPGDMSILFAVICKDGTKGLVVSSYGAKVDLNLLSFMDKVKILGREEQQPNASN